MKLMRRLPPKKLLIPILAIAIFAVTSYAASVTVTQTTLQADSGVYYNVTGYFSATSNGFSVVQAASAASSLPCTWTSGGTCQTAQTAGDWFFSVTVEIYTGATASHTYTVTVTWNTGTGYATMGTALTVTTPATITNAQTMTFLFDTGVTTFTAPTGIVITVA